MPRLIEEPIFCPKCATRLHICWWDDIKVRIYKIRCPECRNCWDYRVLDVGGGNYTISAVQN